MSINYSQKLNMVEHLVNCSSWTNLFDINFFNNARRKWQSTSIDSIEYSAHKNGDAVCLQHKQTASMLLFQKKEDGTVTIEDESKRTYDKHASFSRNIVGETSPVRCDKPQTIDLARFKVSVSFFETGEKSVKFHDSDTIINFPAPIDNQKKELGIRRSNPLRFFSTNEIREDFENVCDHCGYVNLQTSYCRICEQYDETEF